MFAYVAAACGGALGALARWGLTGASGADAGGRPWVTLLVNLTGCLALGLLLGLDRSGHRWWRPFLGTGVLGGFTTYSAFALETVLLVEGGRPGLGAGLVVVSVAGGAAAAALGVLAGRALVREPAA